MYDSGDFFGEEAELTTLKHWRCGVIRLRNQSSVANKKPRTYSSPRHIANAMLAAALSSIV